MSKDSFTVYKYGRASFERGKEGEVSVTMWFDDPSAGRVYETVRVAPDDWANLVTNLSAHPEDAEVRLQIEELHNG
jgi:hypothetical protein